MSNNRREPAGFGNGEFRGHLDNGLHLEFVQSGADFLGIEKYGPMPGLDVRDLFLVLQAAERPDGDAVFLREVADVEESLHVGNFVSGINRWYAS